MQSTLVIVLGLGLLLWLRQHRRRVEPAAMGPVMVTMAIVLLAMLASLLQEFAVAERIVNARSTGGDLRLWHGLGTALVFVQWCGGAWVFKRLSSQAF
jgi:hypothetical protein